MEVETHKDIAEAECDGVESKTWPNCERILGKEAFEKMLLGVPARFAGIYRRALEGKTGLRGAINAKCAECVGFEDATERVGDCKCYRCPLWPYRPYQSEGEE